MKCAYKSYTVKLQQITLMLLGTPFKNNLELMFSRVIWALWCNSSQVLFCWHLSRLTGEVFHGILISG